MALVVVIIMNATYGLVFLVGIPHLVDHIVVTLPCGSPAIFLCEVIEFFVGEVGKNDKSLLFSDVMSFFCRRQSFRPCRAFVSSKPSCRHHILDGIDICQVECGSEFRLMSEHTSRSERHASVACIAITAAVLHYRHAVACDEEMQVFVAYEHQFEHSAIGLFHGAPKLFCRHRKCSGSHHHQ